MPALMHAVCMSAKCGPSLRAMHAVDPKHNLLLSYCHKPHTPTPRFSLLTPCEQKRQGKCTLPTQVGWYTTPMHNRSARTRALAARPRTTPTPTPKGRRQKPGTLAGDSAPCEPCFSAASIASADETEAGASHRTEDLHHRPLSCMLMHADAHPPQTGTHLLAHSCSIEPQCDPSSAMHKMTDIHTPI